MMSTGETHAFSPVSRVLLDRLYVTHTGAGGIAVGHRNDTTSPGQRDSKS